MSDINIKEIRDKLGLSQTEFAKKIGVSLRTVQNYEAGRVVPDSKYEILRNASILSEQPTINYEQKGVPYYNVDFLCGFDVLANDQTVNPDYYINFRQYNNASYWINASGDSMSPMINAGDILAIRQLPEADWFNHIMYGETYAIVTEINRTIKKVRKSTLGDQYLRLIPENLDKYDEQDILKTDVREIFQVLGCMKRLQ